MLAARSDGRFIALCGRAAKFYLFVVMIQKVSDFFKKAC